MRGEGRVVRRSKALTPSDSLVFYMPSEKRRRNLFPSLIILILTQALCRMRGVCSTGFLPCGGEIVAGKGRSDFSLSDLPSCLVLVFWNLPETVEECILIKSVGYVQFILCASGYSFWLRMETRWNLMVYIKSLKKYEHYYS